jgi:Tfp pilus assembly protein PilO
MNDANFPGGDDVSTRFGSRFVDPRSAVTARDALLNVARWRWHRHFGVLGWVGVGAFAAAAAVWFGLHQPAEQEAQSLLRAKVRQLSEARSAASAASAVQRDPHDLARESLPDERERAAVVRKVLALAETNRLSVDRSDYTLQTEEPRLQRLRVTLPLGGSYAQVRQFIGQLLNRMPNVALDSLQIDRPVSANGDLQTTVRLSIFFRAEGS